MSLKDQNKPVKVIAFFLLASLYARIIGSPLLNFQSLVDGEGFKGLVNSSSVIFIGISLLALFLDGLFPKRFKEMIVHRKVKHPLPGSRAFTDIAARDTRIDLDIIAQKFGSLPSEPAEQNQLFYKVYKTCQDSVGVKDAHRSYLLFRDLAFDTYILSLLLAIYTAIFGVGVAKAGIVLLVGLSIGLFLSIVATNFAERFVCNVLAAAKLTPKREAQVSSASASRLG